MDTSQPETQPTQPAAGSASRGPADATSASASSPHPQHDPPARPIVPPASSGETDAQALRSVRAFHFARTQSGAEVDHRTFLPALTWAYRDPQRVRTDYPLVLRSASDSEPDRPFRPLAETLSDLVPASADLLRDNLLRLEQAIREALAETGSPANAQALLGRAADALVQELQLHPQSDARLRDQVVELQRSIAADERLLPFSRGAELTLCSHVALQEQRRRREAFNGIVSQLASRLRTLLAVDEQKAPSSRDAAALDRSMGPSAGRFVDPTALAGVVGQHRGSSAMPPQRRERVLQALQIFEDQPNRTDPLLYILCDDPAVPLQAHADGACDVEQVQDAGASAIARFDELAGQHVPLFRALRVAQLELHGPQGAYDPDRHDPLFAAFDWRSFSQEELLLLPVVLAVTTDTKLTGGGLCGLSQLLLSGRPVRVLASIDPRSATEQLADISPAARPAASAGRPDLGYLAIGHRRAFVWQSSAAVPEHLVRGMRRALESAAPALVLAPQRSASTPAPLLAPQLHTAAAIESRAHPLHGFDPEGGPSWARRFDLSQNPALEQAWSRASLECQTSDGSATTLELAFTFADFCLLDPELAQHFYPVPAGCAGSEALTLVDDYLALTPEDAGPRIPFVWAVERTTGQLTKLALSRDLTLACRDRLALWHTLQELAGIDSEHVERALTAERQRADALLSQRVEELQRQHADELERLRQTAATEVLGRLASALVGLDGATLASPAGAGPVAAPQPAPSQPPPSADAPPSAPEAVEAPAPAEDAADDAIEEPWIDSGLCTSCNDCLDINAQLFKYNPNKQAEIADPSAGSFADLVRAAEKCPARCIHPGKPLDPNEPQLAELIERAKKYN